MKGLFLSVLGILLSIAIVRFANGLEPNKVEYFIQTILELPPDIESEFQIVIDAANQFSYDVESLQKVSSDGAELLEVVKSFFKTVGAFFNIPMSFITFLVGLVRQVLKSLQAVFRLLFGPAVLPID